MIRVIQNDVVTVSYGLVPVKNVPMPPVMEEIVKREPHRPHLR